MSTETTPLVPCNHYPGQTDCMWCRSEGGRRCVPPNPDVDGYHWVRRYRGAPPIPLHWCALWHENAGRGWGQWTQEEREVQWEYIAPCPFPEGHQP